MPDHKLKKSLDAAANVRQAVPSLAASLSPQHHERGKQAPDVEDAIDVPLACRAAFVGLGQGGGRIADAFWKLGYRRVVAINTTDTDFDGLSERLPRLSLDVGGAGKDMNLARQALKGREEEVRDLLAREWGNTPDCALVCVGLGGGTGSGLALPVLELARSFLKERNLPPRVGAIVGLPRNEGQIVSRNAVNAFTDLNQAGASPLIVIDNVRVQALYKPALAQLLPKSNMVVSVLFDFFNRKAAAKSPYMAFDRSELMQLLDGGVVVLGSADIGRVTKPADVSTRIRESMSQSVLAAVDLATARKAGVIFVGSEKVLNTLTAEYFDAGFDMVERTVSKPEGSPSVVHRGVYADEDDKDGDSLQCFTLFSELEPAFPRLRELAAAGGVAGRQPTRGSVVKHLGLDGG